MKRLADHDKREVDGRKPRLDELRVLVVDRRGKHGNITPLLVKLGSVLRPPTSAGYIPRKIRPRDEGPSL